MGDQERERRSVCPKNMVTGQMLAMPGEGPGNLEEAVRFIQEGLAGLQSGTPIVDRAE